MQRRRQYGSSGELDVFGATRYFAGLADSAAVTEEERADRLTTTQLKMRNDKRLEETQESFHGHEQHGVVYDQFDHAQLGQGKTTSAGKSKLAAFLGFTVSPSPEASVREKPAKVSRESNDVVGVTVASMLQGCGHDLDDLGAVMGDRRLQGVRVVRGCAGEERWVVRCGAWEKEHHEKLLDAATPIDHRHDQAEKVGDYDVGNLESDCSSDLFDLDLEDIELSN
ncbi:hypothetical protein ACP70R_014358 [Stipagrostis hirtigluma subsp. patula]